MELCPRALGERVEQEGRPPGCRAAPGCDSVMAQELATGPRESRAPFNPSGMAVHPRGWFIFVQLRALMGS